MTRDRKHSKEPTTTGPTSAQFRVNLSAQIADGDVLFRRLFEAANDAILIADADQIIKCNQRFMEMFGLDPNRDVAGLTPWEFSPEYQRDGCLSKAKGMEYIRAALAGEPQCYDWAHMRNDGTLFDVQASFTRLDVGGKALLLGIFRDITERAQAERALQDSEHRYRTFMEQTTDCVFCYEFDVPIPTDLPVDEQMRQMYNSTLVECNDVCAKSYGASSAQEVVGKKLTELFGTKSGSLDGLFRAVVEGGYRIVDGEGEEMLEDGSRRYYLNNGHGAIEDGKLVRMWGTFRDITDRKEAEIVLQETMRKLEEEHNVLAEKNIALREILDHLEQEKADYRHKLAQLVDETLGPFLDRLRRSDGHLTRRDMVQLDDAFDMIVREEASRYQSLFNSLTPRETEICEMIKTGKSSKDIARQLNLSVQTIHKHRESIRDKLQLKHRDINLSSFLRTRK